MSLLDMSTPQGKGGGLCSGQDCSLSIWTVYRFEYPYPTANGVRHLAFPRSSRHPSPIRQAWHRGARHCLGDLWRILSKGQFVIQRSPGFSILIAPASEGRMAGLEKEGSWRHRGKENQWFFRLSEMKGNLKMALSDDFKWGHSFGFYLLCFILSGSQPTSSFYPDRKCWAVKCFYN